MSCLTVAYIWGYDYYSGVAFAFDSTSEMRQHAHIKLLLILIQRVIYDGNGAILGRLFLEKQKYEYIEMNGLNS